MKSSSVGHQFASTTLPPVLSELLQRVKDKTLVVVSHLFKLCVHLWHEMTDYTIPNCKFAIILCSSLKFCRCIACVL